MSFFTTRSWRPSLLHAGRPPGITHLTAGLICSLIDQSLLLVSWIPFTLGVASAALLRSWWAVLFAPAALSIGTLLGLLAAGIGLNDITDPGFAAGLTFFALLVLLPAATGAAIGAPLGKEIQRVTVGPRATPGSSHPSRIRGELPDIEQVNTILAAGVS